MSKISIGPRPYMAAMPAVLVGANVDGKPNFMTAAWAGVACMEPPMVSVAINKARHTEKGIIESKEFSLNIPAAKDAAETDLCGLISGKNNDKSTVFEVFHGKRAGVPMIRSFPINIDPIVYSSAMYYRIGEPIGKAYSIGKGLKKS